MRSPILHRYLLQLTQGISRRFWLLGLWGLLIIFSITIILTFPESYFLAPLKHCTEKTIWLGIVARILAATGGIIIIYWVTKLIFDEPGNIIYAIVTLQDIRDRKKAEEELRRSEELYRNLVELQMGVTNYVSQTYPIN